MRTLIIPLCLLHAIAAPDTPDTSTKASQFSSFSSYYKKTYKSANEAKYREEIFNKNSKTIKTLNDDPLATYPQGPTFYADLTPDEFKSLILNPTLASNPALLLDYPDWSDGKGKDSKSSQTSQAATQTASQANQTSPSSPISQIIQAIIKVTTNTTNATNATNTTSPTASKNSTITNIIKYANSVGSLIAKQLVNSSDVIAYFKTQGPPPKSSPNSNPDRWVVPAGCASSVDWRKDNRVSYVKMQGACGNCYSFSTTGALESAYMIKHKIAGVTYSDQQITDCCGKGGFGCNGCDGGWQWQALRYIQKVGIVSEEEYQNTSSDDGNVGNCQKLLSPKKILDDKTPFIALTPGNTTALYEAVSKQPVAVGVDASYMQFVLSANSTSLFTNCSSSPQDANHAMLVVGYDSDGNWILKNSWSSYWGDNGYIKLKAGNTCGVANFALYPIVV